ncbi:MAG: 16S rRNA (uracil(1498)-N(3))-methyltransferase [Bryobacterales bacterium]|nr:16S rRNA (uracil(1498)-N(3))-methyltransferase [Bryobacterales bacterium]
MRRRFFVDEIRNGQAEMGEEDARHLVRVLRVERGQRFEISDTRSVYLAEVAEAHKRRVLFRVIEPVSPAPETVRVTLLAALVKFDRFEWLIEKTTEAGVGIIIPLQAERSEKGIEKAAPKRIERWRKIARESSQQARRLAPPEIREPVDWHGVSTGAELLLCLDEAAEAPLLSALPVERRPGAEVMLAVGPEGGWTDRERDRWQALGFKAVSLGGTILRAETAAVVAVAAVRMAWETPTVR